MDPFSIITGIIGIVSAIVGIGSGIKQIKDESDSQDYNKDLNQQIFNREDNSWQRAVEDRSRAGLSIAGLTSGSGSGGTVSQLQAPQGSGQLANLLQNMSSTGFGLANSAYDRKLQKEIATDELELKREQLQHEKLTARWNYFKDLISIKRENSIYEHNMNIAKGMEKNPLATVYGSQPSELERIVQALVNNKDVITKGADKVNEVVDSAKQNIKSAWDNFRGVGKEHFFSNISDSQLKDALGDFTYSKLPTDAYPTSIAKDANGKDYWIIFSNKKRLNLSKYQYENLARLLGIK